MFFIITIGSCTLKFNEFPPQIPDFITYKLDFQDLELEKKGNSNWFVAASKLNEWTSLISENINLPFNSLSAAHWHKAEFFADNIWNWEFDLIDLNSSYLINLFGTIEADSSVLWEMFYSDVKDVQIQMLQGKSDKENTQGSWSFYKYVYQKIDVLKIDWKNADSALIVNYFNIYEQSNNFGDILKISYLNDDCYYNVKLDFYSKKNDNTSKVELNKFLGYGRIKDYSIFNDSLWHCWDIQKNNSDCR